MLAPVVFLYSPPSDGEWCSLDHLLAALESVSYAALKVRYRRPVPESVAQDVPSGRDHLLCALMLGLLICRVRM